MIIEIIQAYPRWSIIVIALGISLFITIVNYFVIDKEKMKASRARQKELQKELKASKDDPAKMMSLQKELMGHTMEQMKHSFKPMFITMIPILIAFWWIKGVFSETTLNGSWFWWYLGFSMAGSIIFRKVFKLQ